MKAKCKVCGYNKGVVNNLCEYCAKSKEDLLSTDWERVNLVTGLPPSKQGIRYYDANYIQE